MKNLLLIKQIIFVMKIYKLELESNKMKTMVNELKRLVVIIIEERCEYVIVGDTDKYKDCLIYMCGTYDNANEVLNRMINNPTCVDKAYVETYTNLKVEKVYESDCWWHMWNLD